LGWIGAGARSQRGHLGFRKLEVAVGCSGRLVWFILKKDHLTDNAVTILHRLKDSSGRALDLLSLYQAHVTRTARIEPVTIPGSIFVSEQFAALLAIKSDNPFVCEFVGVEDLAKGFDRCPLYRLGRR
jgi:hypothetical protein